MTETGGDPAAGGGAPETNSIGSVNVDAYRAVAALLDPPAGGTAATERVVEATAPAAAVPGRKKAKGAQTAAPGAGNATPASKEAGGRRRTPQRDSIMAIVDGCRFWHGPDSESFVTFTNGGHIEHASVRSLEFKRWLCSAAYKATNEVPGGQAIEDALRICGAIAQDGPEQDPWLRVGGRDGRLYVDLCDRERRYVDVSTSGVQLCADGLAPFVRTAAMRALLEPSDPGTASIDLLRPFLNVAADDDFVLAVAWTLGALRPTGPYPLLTISGQQGSGKSNFSRMLRTLVDPNAAPIRSAPKDGRDLIVAAYNCHTIVFDNLSKIDGELSDGLCRLATGGGFSTRQLHTDREEMIFHGQRPIILNGIPTLAERADLADRSIGIRLVTIDESTRRTEAELWREFEAAVPGVLSALFDAMAEGLRNLPTTRLARAPRLADFATWVTACEPGLGWAPGTFMRAFEANRREVNASAFEADPVAVEIRNFIREERPSGWTGTATELLAVLNVRVAEDIRRARTWPFSAQAMGGRVDRAAPLLRGHGLIVERRHSGSRFITIAPMEDAPVHESSQASSNETGA